MTRKTKSDLAARIKQFVEDHGGPPWPRGHGTTFTRESRERAAALVDEGRLYGMQNAELGKMFHLAPTTISRWWRDSRADQLVSPTDYTFATQAQVKEAMRQFVSDYGTRRGVRAHVGGGGRARGAALVRAAMSMGWTRIRCSKAMNLGIGTAATWLQQFPEADRVRLPSSLEPEFQGGNGADPVEPQSKPQAKPVPTGVVTLQLPCGAKIWGQPDDIARVARALQ